MECQQRWGTVHEIIESSDDIEEVVVTVDGFCEQSKAINYPKMTGRVRKGCRVKLNTTAQTLGLGSGGYHFISAVFDQGGDPLQLDGPGHIIKLRYTPFQGRVLSVEEQESPYHSEFRPDSSLGRLPVIAGSLHSMLIPICLAVQWKRPKTRITYLMSDGAALPLRFSRAVQFAKQAGLIQKTITFGHAFGGDYEAVNVYSALLAAKEVCDAELAVVLMGPGVVGTGTAWGTTALEQGEFLNAAAILDGQPVACLRSSLADPRPRHQGVSHHTMTVLKRLVHFRVHAALPTEFYPQLAEQVAELGDKHHLSWLDTNAVFAELAKIDFPVTTMGRSLPDDPLFFHASLAAGLLGAELVELS